MVLELKKLSILSNQIHCNHCGKVFCGDCCNKIIMGGPYKTRKFKVCHVCHTLLDQTTAPYFSTTADHFSSSEVNKNPT